MIRSQNGVPANAPDAEDEQRCAVKPHGFGDWHPMVVK